jgi:hypothetical protein
VRQAEAKGLDRIVFCSDAAFLSTAVSMYLWYAAGVAVIISEAWRGRRRAKD